jgi:hypothetical protein
MDLTGYLTKANIPESDIKLRQLASTIEFMVQQGIIKGLNYGEFIQLLYQFKRHLDNALLWAEPDNPGHLK